MAADNGDANADENGEAKELTMEDKVDLVAGQNFRQMVMAGICLLLMPLLFIACVICLATAAKTTDKLLAIEPVNRAEILADKIGDVKAQVEKQYAEYLVKMEDPQIFTLNKKFTVLYDLTQQSDQDYGKLLVAYQKIVYQIASKVRGSGEWYHYYERDLNKFVSRQRRRETAMQRYFQEN